MRSIGTPAELERRRRRAVQLLEQGESPTVVARILGVARGSLYRWRAQARAGPQGLAARPLAGPAPRLSDQQLAELRPLLDQGATAHGWPDPRWTAKRLAELVRRLFGVRFHPEHVRKMLKQRLGWPPRKSRRKPRRRRGGAETEP
jgi:transposase